jgi:SRSO17 transposase
MAHLAEGLGHSDRHAVKKGYGTRLMLPLTRKSVELMAARIAPLHAPARLQSLRHFVAKAAWSDEEMLRRDCQWIVPKMDISCGKTARWFESKPRTFPRCHDTKAHSAR